VSRGSKIVLTQDNPQCWIPLNALQPGPFYAQAHWGVGGGDVDQVVAVRTAHGLCDTVAPLPGRTGRSDRYPFMYQLNDDANGGTGETVRADNWLDLMGVVERLFVGVYHNDPYRQLSRGLELMTAVTFPGYGSVIVQSPGLNVSACTMMRVDVSPHGVTVLHDIVPVDPRGWPSSFEALMGAWTSAMWGQGK